MKRLKSLLLLLAFLPTIRCAGPAASSAPASAEVELAPITFAKPQLPSSAPASVPSFEPQATQPRFMGKLWTLCDVLYPERGFCLSVAQAREIWLRFKEDQAHYKRLTIDAIGAQDKALAFLDGERAARARAILAGVLGTLAALAAGVGAGILIGHFLIRR